MDLLRFQVVFQLSALPWINAHPFPTVYDLS